MEGKQSVGMLLIGAAIGLYLPKFPAPLDFLNVYLGIILLVVAIVLIIRS